VGCAAPSDPCFDTEAWATIGTGENQWEDLNEGDPVTMVHGPQGGWHVLGSVRAGQMGPYVDIHYTITDVKSGTLVANNLYKVGLQMDEECSGLFPGMYAYLDVTELAVGEMDTPPELLAYHQLELTMNISNEYGHEVLETLRVIAQLDPMDMD